MKIFEQLSLSKYFDNIKHKLKEFLQYHHGPLLQASNKAEKFGGKQGKLQIFFGYMQKI